jgi:hypothetical protein
MDIGTNEMRSDIRLPDENDDDNSLEKSIKEQFEDGKNLLLTVLAAMMIEKIMECKEA